MNKKLGEALAPDVESAITRLESGMFEPQSQASTMEAAGRLLGFDHFCLVHANVRDLNVIASESSLAGFDAYEAGGWVEADYRAATINDTPDGALYLDHLATPDEQRLNSAIFNELYVPMRMAHFAGWRLNIADETWIYSMARAKEAGSVTPDEAARLVSFMPYANRTLMLAHNMRNIRVQGAADLAGIAGIPLIVIDHRGRAIAVNAHAEALFTRCFGIRDARLWSLDPDSQERLEALARAASHKGGPDHLANFVVKRKHAGPLLVKPTPVRGLGLDALPGARILLTLVDSKRRQTIATQDLRELFRLSAAEAEVAAALASGKDPQQVAEQRGVAVGTVRVQIRHLFEKMEVNRISDLVAVVTNLAQTPLGQDDDPNPQ